MQLYTLQSTADGGKMEMGNPSAHICGLRRLPAATLQSLCKTHDFESHATCCADTTDADAGDATGAKVSKVSRKPSESDKDFVFVDGDDAKAGTAAAAVLATRAHKRYVELEARGDALSSDVTGLREWLEQLVRSATPYKLTPFRVALECVRKSYFTSLCNITLQLASHSAEHPAMAAYNAAATELLGADKMAEIDAAAFSDLYPLVVRYAKLMAAVSGVHQAVYVVELVGVCHEHPLLTPLGFDQVSYFTNAFTLQMH
jgi:hypothetical protein